MFLPEAQSRAQALEYGTHHRRIDMAFQTDPNTPRQLNTNRARTRRRSCNLILRPGKLLLLSYADRQQLYFTRRSWSKTASLMQAPPLEHLVGVDAVLHRYTSDRRARL